MAKTHSSKTHPPLERKPGGPDNWVEKAGGLPDYIERIAKHLHHDKGMTISHAIATAVNVVKKMCAGGDLNFKGKQNVNAKSRAQACKAVAEWSRKKAGSRIKATETKGRPLTDLEFAELIEQHGLPMIELAIRKQFDPTKILRNPGDGKFANKYTPTELLAARKIVEAGISNLQVGDTFELPNRAGWVKREGVGYRVQGPAGLNVTVGTLAEAVAAAANIIAGELSKVGETKK